MCVCVRDFGLQVSYRWLIAPPVVLVHNCNTNDMLQLFGKSHFRTLHWLSTVFQDLLNLTVHLVLVSSPQYEAEADYVNTATEMSSWGEEEDVTINGKSTLCLEICVHFVVLLPSCSYDTSNKVQILFRRVIAKWQYFFKYDPIFGWKKLFFHHLTDCVIKHLQSKIQPNRCGDCICGLHKCTTFTCCVHTMIRIKTKLLLG